MSRPRLLDLFSGAGGAAVGYHRAGFDVVGVDIKPHPNFPFELIVADAMEVLKDTAFLDTFDVVHASPPCPGYSTICADKDKHPRLIAPVRDALRGRHYVIENVIGAKRFMISPTMLCGTGFGLAVERHRLFESSTFLLPVVCSHTSVAVGVYGKHLDTRTWLRPNGKSRGYRATSMVEAQGAMGIDWMDWDDLKDAIPPAYTEYIGCQLLDHLQVGV